MRLIFIAFNVELSKINIMNIRIFSNKGYEKLCRRTDIKILFRWRNNLGTWWEVNILKIS
jgi:hypothetical protein